MRKENKLHGRKGRGHSRDITERKRVVTTRSLRRGRIGKGKGNVNKDTKKKDREGGGRNHQGLLTNQFGFILQNNPVIGLLGPIHHYVGSTGNLCQHIRERTFIVVKQTGELYVQVRIPVNRLDPIQCHIRVLHRVSKRIGRNVKATDVVQDVQVFPQDAFQIRDRFGGIGLVGGVLLLCQGEVVGIVGCSFLCLLCQIQIPLEHVNLSRLTTLVEPAFLAQALNIFQVFSRLRAKLQDRRRCLESLVLSLMQLLFNLLGDITPDLSQLTAVLGVLVSGHLQVQLELQVFDLHLFTLFGLTQHIGSGEFIELGVEEPAEFFGLDVFPFQVASVHYPLFTRGLALILETGHLFLVSLLPFLELAFLLLEFLLGLTEFDFVLFQFGFASFQPEIPLVLGPERVVPSFIDHSIRAGLLGGCRCRHFDT
ncbi:uncharacterized protein N7496_003403 [Penicillium cataractarum]|uniref:Uncharacterized protein n=1 Tax=Penicillium cataractarum TaxID=2100454 RepID=A0A9W9SM85_9EURO|nr:uncharacterized protein N7496_003403 [Penicillium cataractarum]KAJ5380975.1 hypothetical protein N7496_003403 [Penicillium cataractarum]